MLSKPLTPLTIHLRMYNTRKLPQSNVRLFLKTVIDGCLIAAWRIQDSAQTEQSAMMKTLLASSQWQATEARLGHGISVV